MYIRVNTPNCPKCGGDLLRGKRQWWMKLARNSKLYNCRRCYEDTMTLTTIPKQQNQHEIRH